MFVMTGLAAVKMLAFRHGPFKKVASWDTVSNPPAAARLAGALSLGLWTAVVLFGRWMGFTTWQRAALIKKMQGGDQMTNSGLLVRAAVSAVLALAAGVATAAAPPAAAADAAPQYKTSWEEFQALKARAHGGAKKTFDQLPDWTGLWTRDFSHGLAYDSNQKNQEETTAVLTPEYKKRHEKKVSDFHSKGVEWDQLSYCLPAGFPRWASEPFLREFVLRPEQTWLINEMVNEVRRVYTDGRGHIPEDEAYPMWEGDSIGFWDGDTLVVHTNNLKPGQYQRLQPDYSDKVTTVERWHKVNADLIEDALDIYDPEGLARPWHVVQRYNRVKTPGLRVAYWSCEENNNVVRTPDGSTQFNLPGEPGYKDPNKLQDSLSVDKPATRK
jgi:hypothetical protein